MFIVFRYYLKLDKVVILYNNICVEILNLRNEF